MDVTIRAESPLQSDGRELVAALNAELLRLTPPDFCSHLTVEQMADADTTAFAAREDGLAVASHRAGRKFRGPGCVVRPEGTVQRQS